ncbi:MAG: B12-binding domain-containing radical SAM protein [Oscillospiraceae bacterium]|nr:B12-binding domain-containing radical SAM protein [Oscillospiraceae bacterium]
MKIRFIEPGNQPYRKSLKNYFVYDKYIRTPSNGMITLATILKREYEDVFCYSESISEIVWDDVLDSDIIFISIFTFNANRGYELAEYIKKKSKALVVFGGLHATLNYNETIRYCDYVLRGEGDELILQFTNAVRDNAAIDFPGVVYKKNGEIITMGEPEIPDNIDTIPDRNLLYKFREVTKYNTIWPQVHASRSCPHNCDYCALVAAFGRKVRTRPPESVADDIEAAIEFFSGHKRLAKVLWITDDNFFADREWAKSVLNEIIDRGIKYSFTIQIRYEVGFDDEMLELLKKAGFDELSMGIEFLEDESFEKYNKKSTYEEILRSVKNIQSHGMRTRGLFIVGADNHTKGIGERLADFVIKNNICGVLIQSMYFIPGTPVYDSHKDKLIDTADWSRNTGRVVHYPQNMTAAELQREIIIASGKIYSFKRLLQAIFRKRGLERILFIGEYFWQKGIRRELKKELSYLEQLGR